MNNLQENVGGSSQYLTTHSIIDMIPEVRKGNSKMDIRNLLAQLLPRLNKLQSSDSRFDAKMSNPAELLGQVESGVLSPLLDVMKYFHEENSGRNVTVSGDGGGSNNGGSGGWSNSDLSCDTNHWRDGPIDIKPREELLASPRLSVPQQFNSDTEFESEQNSKLVMNPPRSTFTGPLSPSVIRERIIRSQFQGQSYSSQDRGGMLNGTRTRTTNTIPQMSPPMDLTSSTLNGLGSGSGPFNSQNNPSQLEQSSKSYQELSSNPPYPRELQLEVHNQEQNSNHTNSTIQDFSPVKHTASSHQEGGQVNVPYDGFCLDNSVSQTDDEVMGGRDCFHSEHLSPKEIRIKTENDDLADYVTSSGRNRGLGKANEPRFCCQVCGDIAAGFHCGAYVCEACKKFYLRCLKNGGSVTYTCPKTQECGINKETRSHCQFCRYKKCLALGMYKPGRDDSKHLRVDFKSIPCKVCAAPSSGFHFGAITCEGCKGFFRRMVKEKLHKKFVCTAGGNCDVASSNRTACKACRYQKCVEIGMALEGTRLGRQSNSIKRSTLIQYMNSGLDVALFPKLGEGEPDEAHHKVDMLIRGSLPESVSTAASSHLPQIGGLLKIKEESETDENYGKCLSNRLPPMSPTYKVNDDSQLKCSSQETVPGNKSYLHMDSNRIVEAPSGESCESRGRIMPLCRDYPLGKKKEESRDEYEWKSDGEEQPESHATSTSSSTTTNLPGSNASDGGEYTNHKRTYSTDEDTAHLSAPCRAKYQKTLEGKDPGTYQAKTNSSFSVVSEAELNPKKYGCHDDHDLDQIRPPLSFSDDSSRRQSGGLSGKNISVVPLISRHSDIRTSDTGSMGNPQQASASENRTSSLPFSLPYETHIINKRKMLEQFSRSGYKIDYEIPKLHVYDPDNDRSFCVDDTSSYAYVSATGEPSSAATRLLTNSITAREDEESEVPEVMEEEVDAAMISPRESKELLLHVIKAFRELENITTKQREPLRMEKPPCNEKSAAWWAAYESFMHHAKYTLRFVKKIPGFRELDMGDQITLVRESVYPITLLIHGRLYEPNVKKAGWFCNTEEEKIKIHHFFPKFKELENHLTYTGKLFKDIDLSLEEFAFLSAIMVFTIDSFLVKDSDAIQNIQGKLTDAFFDFCTEIETHWNRPGILLLRLAELKRANFEHTQIAIETQRANPDVDFSQLWHEMFLSKVNY